MNFFNSSKETAAPATTSPSITTATSTMAAPVPSKYPRTPYSKWAQVLIWLNCVSLVICGTTTFIFACIRPKRPSHFFLSLYMVIFGVLCVMAELRLPAAERLFGILCTKSGLAYCFIFVGTLGVSFWVGTYAGVLIPFISGICSIVVGALCVTDKLMHPEGTTSRVATETTIV